jgi:hypothetical protein
MPEEDYSAAEVEESSEVFSMIFPPDDETSEVVEPGEESLDLPTSFVSTERSSILCAANTVPPIRCDHFGPILVREFVIERVAIVGFVPDEPLRITANPETIESVFDQGHFSRRSAFCPSGDRKTIAVNDCHDLGSFAPLGLSDLAPPFFAETKVPSMKHSSRLSPPRFRRSSARATRRSSKKPSSLHR